MELTVEQLESDEWCEALNDIMPEYEIDTAERVAAFIAQCQHESGNFRFFKENLNYSAKALDAVFGKYFARAGRDATEYERQPEKIANIVYADRMGNGDTDSGDGWSFRGRGLIQLTGRNNYTSFAEDNDMDVDDVPEYLETKKGAVHSAAWFWNKNKLNNYADEKDLKTMTKRINGGYNGLDDRIKHYDHALEVLA
jgi:putative chitinase